MTREEIIRNLKYTIEKHKNDTVNTFGTNISAMCKDILDYLEQEPILDKIRTEIDELETYYDNDYFSGNRDAMFKCNDVMHIIDKYR